MFDVDLVELLPFFLNVNFLCGFMLGVFVGRYSLYKFLSKHYKEVKADYQATLERRDKEIKRLESQLTNLIINDSAKYFDNPKS